MNRMVVEKLVTYESESEAASLAETEAFDAWQAARKRSKHADNMLRGALAMLRAMES